MNIGKDLNISELLQAYDAVILVSVVILLGSAILDIRTLGQLTCCARLPFPSPFHCLPQNWTNLCTLTRAMWHKLGLSSVLRLYKFYFCHWTVVVKKGFLTLWVWFNLYTESWLLRFSQVHSFGLFLFSVMVQKMIEHLEYLVRYMCKTKIKFTNDWQGSLEAPVSGEIHHLVKQQCGLLKR